MLILVWLKNLKKGCNVDFFFFCYHQAGCFPGNFVEKDSSEIGNW